MTPLGLFIVGLAVLLGGAWRRWWGSRESEGRPLYRAMQAGVGIAALGALCWFASGSFWKAPLLTLLAIGWLTERAQCVPAIWEGWRLVDERFGLPALTRAFTGYTTYAEATAGSVIWAIAVLL